MTVPLTVPTQHRKIAAPSAYLHSLSDFVDWEFYSASFGSELSYHIDANWETRADVIQVLVENFPAPERVYEKNTLSERFIRIDDPVALLLISTDTEDGRFKVGISATQESDAKDVVAKLRRLLPKMEAREDTIPVSFWNWGGQQGAQKTVRDIATQDWADISRNYSDDTRTQLERLFALNSLNEDSGKLVLWQGPPGTGKTHCVRSLMQAWSPWATSEYVVDPDSFFNNAGYLMSVLLSRSDDIYDSILEDKKKQDTEKWRILICEDTGELLAEDASQRTGQGLSRCLNTVDGLVGQGLKVAIIITTNEKLSQLHPAIRRPGRTHAVISFDSFSGQEATEWLGEDVDRAMTLAEMYARKNDHKMSEGQASSNRRRVGFQIP